MVNSEKRIWETQYLTQEHLDGFNSYKYNSVDTNPLGIYVIHPFWNKVVQLCPMWLAPNLLTFVGFLQAVSAFLLLSAYDFNFYASSRDHPEHLPIPNWVFLVVSLLIFLSHTLDGIDGKQARRTQTSGPLGELFDHGLDSWTTVLIPTAMYSIFGRTEHSISPLRLYFVLWNVFITFYLSHWEKYNTGVLFLPWGYDFSMLISTVIFLVTGIYGYELWKFDAPFNLNAGRIVELFFYVTAVFCNAPVVAFNIYRSYHFKTGKMLSLVESVRPLVPVVMCFLICSLWVVLSPTDILSRHPRLVFFMTGTVFSNICTRLIVSEMSSMRCQMLNGLLAPLAVATLLSLTLSPTAYALESILVYLMFTVVVLSHIHYGTCVVRQMCRHFHIYCFQIRKQED